MRIYAVTMAYGQHETYYVHAGKYALDIGCELPHLSADRLAPHREVRHG